MGNIQKSQRGFGAVEFIIVLLLVGLLGFIGWTVYNSSRSASGNNAARRENDPYADWKTYTLKYEKASFKYPPTWQVNDTSVEDANIGGGGTDNVRLIGDKGFRISMTDAGPGSFASTQQLSTVLRADPITVLGQDAYLLAVAEADNTEQAVSRAVLTTSQTDTVSSFVRAKHVVAPELDGIIQDKLIVTFDYNAYAEVNGTPGNPTLVTTPLQTLLADKNYKEARLILESMNY